MEKDKDDCQSNAGWGLMQDLTSWSITDRKKDPREELVYDPKRVETTVSKVTVGGTPCCHGLKVLLLESAHVQACLKFANDHLDDAEEAWAMVICSMGPKQMFLVLTPLAVFGEAWGWKL